MRAVVYTRYGSPEVLELIEVDTPVPGDEEVLVEVQAVSVNGSDWEGLRGQPLYSRLGGLAAAWASCARVGHRRAGRGGSEGAPRCLDQAMMCMPTFSVIWAGSPSMCACRARSGAHAVGYDL
jgi:hypothetical protein